MDDVAYAAVITPLGVRITVMQQKQVDRNYAYLADKCFVIV